ncbi:MAG TPA: diguanylate cyclase [Gammaproteobacteria bacterium]|nr:diguanylate cyclase [Gammaproteobacteria bacterium]
MQPSRSAGHVGAAGTLDQGMRDAIARFRFPYPLEQQFRDAHLERNLPRARFATAIYLALVLVVTAINMFAGVAPPPGLVLEPIYLLRLGVACPALVLILVATYARPLHRHYQWIAATAVTVTGLSVMTISGLAAASGFPQFQMGDVLVLVYATLFLGLLVRAVVAVAVALCLGFVGIGVTLAVPPEDLVFAASVLIATGLMAVLSAGRVERLVRTSFVETQLLNDIAERDGLSGLYNRRMFDTLARRLWQQAQRNAEALQVILVDIDHFKPYNDLYGHQAGDDCIRRVAGIIARAAKRPFDFCARYGGEEFALVLYAPSSLDPSALPEQIRRDIMAQQLPHAGSDAAQVITVSVGSAIAEAGTKRSLAGLIQTADEALYRAKQMGRNRVLHIDAGLSETPTGAFKIFAVK